MKLFNKFVIFFQNYHRRSSLAQLRRMPERLLVDCGFSPVLLEQGLIAWPWREDNQHNALSTIGSIHANGQPCVNELQQYTDSELVDLVDAYDAIGDALRYGRPGIDAMSNRTAA